MHKSIPVLILLWLFFPQESNGQNLVSNEGFETFSTCPNTASQLPFAVGWNTSANSPDYFHVCAGNGTTADVPDNICGFQQPYAGDGYIGILCYGSFSSSYINNIREYATGTLTSPLVVGATYSVTFNVVLMNMSSHKTDHLGAKFTTTYEVGMPTTNSAHVFSTTAVSDTLNWTTITGTFVADSAYNFIVIGNHFDDAACTVDSIQPITFGWNAYYFIDGVEVTEVNQTPVAMFTADNHICPGTCTDFTNVSNFATSYEWTFQGGSPSVSTDVNPTNICYNTPGSYGVQLIASNTVTSDTLFLTNYITVYPYPAPQGITQSGDTLFANTGATTYQWYYNGNLIAGATDYFYVAPSGGDYNVVATDENGCEVEAVIFNVIASASFEVKGLEFEAFPNPVVEEVRFNTEDLIFKTAVEISVYNVLGERIYSAVNCQLSTVDCRLFHSGMYWLEVSAEGKIFRGKFLKQ
jgi:PKD repeat protein